MFSLPPVKMNLRDTLASIYHQSYLSMRLLTFCKHTETKIGIMVTWENREMVLDLSAAYPAIFPDLKSLLSVWEGHRVQIEKLVLDPNREHLLEIHEIQWKPVITHPEKIVCIGLNYRDHAIEINAKIPEYPVVFSKFNNVLTGHLEPIFLPGITKEVDFEAELAVIIGKPCKDVLAADAQAYIAGYSIFHDVSARDYQMRTSQWTLGKSFDSFGPLGPWMVTADEIPDPQSLDISLHIGDELLQSSNTREMIFSVPVLIEELSKIMTLMPGDIIATGTPAGVGFTRKPPRYLQPGDVVTIRIQNIGMLQNSVS